MKVGEVIFRPSAEHANPRGVCAFFAEVFAALEAKPRAVKVEIDFSEATAGEPVVVDLEEGEPIFRQRGRNAAHGRFHGQWLAEHAVPLTLSHGVTALCLAPANGHRVRVRLQSRLARLISRMVRTVPL